MPLGEADLPVTQKTVDPRRKISGERRIPRRSETLTNEDEPVLIFPTSNGVGQDGSDLRSLPVILFYKYG
jgi:hypothetical protein